MPILAIQATQRGLVGGKDFPGLAKALDLNNSVAISKVIELAPTGPRQATTFLNGKNLWRDHISDFVAYTVATAKHDKAGQKKAVNDLITYIQVQAAFFAKATGLPKQALVNDLTAHVLQLKGQLDAYAAGNYAQAYTLTNAAYEHMGMTADVLAGAIAKQKGLGRISSPKADLQVALDRLLGEHAAARNVEATRPAWVGREELPGSSPRRSTTTRLRSPRRSSSLYGAAAGKDVPERQEPLARPHQRLRRRTPSPPPSTTKPARRRPSTT